MLEPVARYIVPVYDMPGLYEPVQVNTRYARVPLATATKFPLVVTPGTVGDAEAGLLGKLFDAPVYVQALPSRVTLTIFCVVPPGFWT